MRKPKWSETLWSHVIDLDEFDPAHLRLLRMQTIEKIASKDILPWEKEKQLLEEELKPYANTTFYVCLAWSPFEKMTVADVQFRMENGRKSAEAHERDNKGVKTTSIATTYNQLLAKPALNEHLDAILVKIIDRLRPTITAVEPTYRS